MQANNKINACRFGYVTEPVHPRGNLSLGSNGGIDHDAGSAGGSPSTGRRKFERRIEVRCVFCRVGHVVSNVGRAASRRGALRRCWKLCTKRLKIPRLKSA